MPWTRFISARNCCYLLIASLPIAAARTLPSLRHSAHRRAAGLSTSLLLPSWFINAWVARVASAVNGARLTSSHWLDRAIRHLPLRHYG